MEGGLRAIRASSLLVRPFRYQCPGGADLPREREGESESESERADKKDRVFPRSPKSTVS